MLISPKYNRAGLLSIWNEYSDTEIPTLDDIDRVSPFTCWHYHDIPEPTWWNEVYLLRKGTRVIGECIVYCVLWSLCSCGWYFGCVISSCKRMKWWHSVHLGCRPRSSCSFNTIQFKILRSTRGTLYTISFHSTKSLRIKNWLPPPSLDSSPPTVREYTLHPPKLTLQIPCTLFNNWMHNSRTWLETPSSHNDIPMILLAPPRVYTQFTLFLDPSYHIISSITLILIYYISISPPPPSFLHTRKTPLFIFFSSDPPC